MLENIKNLHKIFKARQKINKNLWSIKSSSKYIFKNIIQLTSKIIQT